MPEFPHLPLRGMLQGNFRFKGFNNKKDPRTQANLANRKLHADTLDLRVDHIEQDYQYILTYRRDNGFPDLPHEEAVPLYLQIDPKGFDVEALKGFGIEIIAEDEDGFVIGASVDQFKSLRARIKAFLNDKNNNAAQLWDIIEGKQWRAEHILTEELYDQYQHGIDDEQEFTVDISIACYTKIPSRPVHKEGWTSAQFEKSLDRWERKSSMLQQIHDDLTWQRQNEIQQFIELHGGAVISHFVEFDDSFGFRAVISGQALKDIVLNYPYVFEIAEHSELEALEGTAGPDAATDLNLLPPREDAPHVCVIDSGLQENHRLLAPAVLRDRSINFVTYETTTADEVAQGGHGTKVAGAILYGNQIPHQGEYQLPCFLLNARVLDKDKAMSGKVFPPDLMEDISIAYMHTPLFNLSINSWVACRKIHMSQWAAQLDRLMHSNSTIYVVSAGNLPAESHRPNRPGIKEHLRTGRAYPNYLLEDSSRIADPAQSAFSLTVGSVCVGDYIDEDQQSFGRRDEISSFSRSGFGLWGAIKPELVEYGGDWVHELRGENLSYKDSTSPELVKTGPGGTGRSDVGTSFAAPKVTHIAAQLAGVFPRQSSLFHKALLIQSARLPQAIFEHPTAEHIRHYGYGIPSLQRAIQNNAQRITFTSNGQISPSKAHLFTVSIPRELRRPGDDYDILIEVSLCYTAKPRRTRRYLKSYLSAWLSWESSQLGQSFRAFQNAVLQDMENRSDEDNDQPDDAGGISWAISNNPRHGLITGVKRQASANQKDWAVLKSYELPDELSFAVIGHKGWEKDITEEIPYAFVVSFEVMNAEVPLYELMERVNVEVEVGSYNL